MRGTTKRVIVAVCAGVLVVAVLFWAIAGTNEGGSNQVSASASSSSPAKNDETSTNSAQSEDSIAQGTASNESEQNLPPSTAPVGEHERDVQDSEDVTTAAEAYEDTNARGFEGAKIEADFDLNGTYHDLVVLDEESASKYPSYSFSYVSSEDVLWRVVVNDGNYVAVPMQHNGKALSKQIVFSENDYVTQYDGLKNEYSDFSLDVLAQQGIVGVRVDVIDAVTLDSYSFDQLEAM